MSTMTGVESASGAGGSGRSGNASTPTTGEAMRWDMSGVLVELSGALSL